MKSLFALVAFLPVTALATPATLSHSGHLLDGNGTPVNGTNIPVTFSLFPSTDSGALASWSETDTLTVEDGYFSTVLGDNVAFPADAFDDAAPYLGIAVSGVEMLPRKQLDAVPYALHAASLDGPHRIFVHRYTHLTGADYTQSWANTGYGAFSYTKRAADTSLKITWTASLRTISGASNGGVCSWRYQLNGISCAPTDLALFQHDTGSSPSADKHLPHSTTVVCDGIPAGNIDFILEARRRDGDEDCYFGWHGNLGPSEYTSTVVIEEVTY